AARRLRHGDQSVTRVALDAGYDSHEGFTRAFRDAFGRAPTAFRQQFREQPLPESFAELEAREARHCITRRFIGPYEACGQAWGELTSWAASAGLIQRSIGSLGLVYDDPDITPAEKLRYDAALVFEQADLASVSLPQGL